MMPFAIPRAAMTIAIYIISYYGLVVLWDSLLHFQHRYIGPPHIVEKIVFPAILLPLILGLISAIILRPTNIVQYWPIVVAPFVLATLRFILDDVSQDWLLQNVLWLICATGFMALLSVTGAWIGMHAMNKS